MAPRYSTVFLDRDGTLNVDYGYIKSPEQLELIPGVANAIAKLKQAGFAIVIVTNQSAINRGICSAAEVEAVNAALVEQLRIANPAATIDALVYCPHRPDESCDCRKPKAGLVSRIQFNAASSWVVGDKTSDLHFGRNIGIPAEQLILVLTGHGREHVESAQSDKVLVCENLSKAAEIIVSQ